jgi:4-phytase/acid phosphatase
MLGVGFGMRKPKGIRAGQARFKACVAVLLFAVAFQGAPAARGDELRLAIILTRHGVRSPLKTSDEMAGFASNPWPKWEVAPAIQTPRGNLLVAYMGDYYRTRFSGDGVLSGNPDVDGPLVFIRADNDQRTVETGRILGKSLLLGAEPVVHSLPGGVDDPLFKPYMAHVGHADPFLAVAAIQGRLGGDSHSIERAYATQIAELKAILYGPGPVPAQTPLDEPTRISPGHGEFPAVVTGVIHDSWLITDSLLLEYADGMPSADVGWGRANGQSLTDLLALHELYFDLVGRTRYMAQVEGSNLASHIVDTLEQAALGQPVPGALGPTGERLVVVVGHDGNIANIGGLFDMNWWIPGTQANPMLPGGAMIFELWARSGQPNAYYVRTSYVSQTLDQMREAAPLTADNPPAVSPIFVPGCSGSGPGYDAPLDSFVRQARRVIDPKFVADEP